MLSEPFKVDGAAAIVAGVVEEQAVANGERHVGSGADPAADVADSLIPDDAGVGNGQPAVVGGKIPPPAS